MKWWKAASFAEDNVKVIRVGEDDPEAEPVEQRKQTPNAQDLSRSELQESIGDILWCNKTEQLILSSKLRQCRLLAGRRTMYVRMYKVHQYVLCTEKKVNQFHMFYRYGPVSFLPSFLADQFSQLSNMYFLVIAVLQQVPDLSPTGRFGTVLTLAVLLAVSLLKEMLEDLRRRRADAAINNRTAAVFDRGAVAFKEIAWKRVKVGDVIEVVHGSPLPADAVILSSSEPMGVCYIETSTLDGESNLKIRRVRCTY